MKTKLIQDGWQFAAVAAAGVGVFFVVRLLLPTGEAALAPIEVGHEPPPPVFSVALPSPPLRQAVEVWARSPQPAPAVAQNVSRPIAAPKQPTAKPAQRAPVRKQAAKATKRAKPAEVETAPAVQIAPASPPAAQEPREEAPRVLAYAPPAEKAKPKQEKAPAGQAKKQERKRVVVEHVIAPEPTPAKPEKQEKQEQPDKDKGNQGQPPGKLKHDSR